MTDTMKPTSLETMNDPNTQTTGPLEPYHGMVPPPEMEPSEILAEIPWKETASPSYTYTPTTPLPPSSIQSTLNERGKRYGDFTYHAQIVDRLLYAMQNEAAWDTKLAPFQRQALRVIADKIARILNGDPNYDDNWRDIAGYATLVLERLPK